MAVIRTISDPTDELGERMFLTYSLLNPGWNLIFFRPAKKSLHFGTFCQSSKGFGKKESKKLMRFVCWSSSFLLFVFKTLSLFFWGGGVGGKKGILKRAASAANLGFSNSVDKSGLKFRPHRIILWQQLQKGAEDRESALTRSTDTPAQLVGTLYV